MRACRTRGVAFILFIILLCGCGNGDGDGTTPPPTLTSISVAPVDSYIAKGTNLQFTATGRYSDGHTRIITSQVSWTSTDAAVAVVNGTGLVSAGLTSGVTQIVATLENVSGSTTLNVVSVSSISVSPAASIAPGTRIKYTATGTLTGSATTQDLTSYAAWTSSDVTVAEISSEGLATGKAVGLTNIRAIFQSTVGTEVLTVSEVVSIALTPSVANIPLGTSQTFAAVGTLTDGA
ncbi:MAG: Ig-like domain-containing protein, partial [bacterium]